MRLDKARSRERELTRALILALLAERGEEDALVYLPRGMERMRDMAKKLLAMRPEGCENSQITAIQEELNALSNEI